MSSPALVAVLIPTRTEVEGSGAPSRFGGAWWFESRSAGPPGSVAARLSPLVASTAVGAGWTSGVWREVARPTLSLGSARDR